MLERENVSTSIKGVGFEFRVRSDPPALARVNKKLIENYNYKKKKKLLCDLIEYKFEVRANSINTWEMDNYRFE